jgi:flagellar motor switch protein FliN/FliY
MEEATNAAAPAPEEVGASQGVEQGVQAPQFEELARSTAGQAGGAHPSIDILMDVPVTLSLEVGRATMSVGELLKLGQGAVVELDRAVGEPLDVMVNGALVARGEIVLVNDKFGIRLTSIVEPGSASNGERA